MEKLNHVSRLKSDIFPVSKAHTFGEVGLATTSIGILIALSAPPSENQVRRHDLQVPVTSTVVKTLQMVLQRTEHLILRLTCS